MPPSRVLFWKTHWYFCFRRFIIKIYCALLDSRNRFRFLYGTWSWYVLVAGVRRLQTNKFHFFLPMISVESEVYWVFLEFLIVFVFFCVIKISTVRRLVAMNLWFYAISISFFFEYVFISLEYLKKKVARMYWTFKFFYLKYLVVKNLSTAPMKSFMMSVGSWLENEQMIWLWIMLCVLRKWAQAYIGLVGLLFCNFNYY